MNPTQDPQTWQAPHWHPDHGDPEAELGHLRSFALKLLWDVPNATAMLEVPELGLMDVRVELPSGTVAEVYSVPSSETDKHRRYAIFLCRDTASESEIYAESPEDASNLFAVLSAPSRNGAEESRNLGVSETQGRT